MDGELKLLKMAGTSSLAPCGRGRNLRRLIPTPVSRVKDHLFSLNKFLLVFQWQIGCQRSLKVCHGWKPSTVIPKLTRSLNFISCWQWPLPFELRGTIAPWGMQRDFVVVQMKLKTQHFGMWDRHQRTASYIYISVCLYFHCEIIDNAVTGTRLEGSRGMTWSQPVLCLWQQSSHLPRCFVEAFHGWFWHLGQSSTFIDFFFFFSPIKREHSCAVRAVER